MKKIYRNIELKEGVHNGGICKIEIAPIEWLEERIDTDFATGAVFDALLTTGKDWIVVSLTPESYLFEERAKTGKAGQYYEIIVGGTTNELDPTIKQLLETLRYHQFIIKATDRDRRTRVIGNVDKGMKMSISGANKNTEGGGVINIAVDFAIDLEIMPPFIIDPCAGIINHNRIEAVTNDSIPPSYLSINFLDGNNLGHTEVEISNDPGTTSTFLLPPGTIFIAGDAAFWASYLETENIIIRWRKRCISGRLTEWASDTFANPFY